MLIIALLAMIGAMIDAWAAYWIVYGVYCSFWLVKNMYDLCQKG